MDIGKHFSSSKKRNLSGTSSEATDSKKAKEATTSSSYSNHEVFKEGLDSSSCRSVLFDCLKNLESKVNDIFQTANILKENQIKGEKQLTDLAETKLKEEMIKSLGGQVPVLYVDLKENGSTKRPTGTLLSQEMSPFSWDEKIKR